VNIDRLIDRIEKALREEATTDPVFHALAKEYAKYRTQIDERLEHCVTLIRSGKDFAARELAEQPPDVLTLMEKLSFSNDGKWRSICDEKGLYVKTARFFGSIERLPGVETRTRLSRFSR